jgi:hypothetical protein
VGNPNPIDANGPMTIAQMAGSNANRPEHASDATGNGVRYQARGR